MHQLFSRRQSPSTPSEGRGTHNESPVIDSDWQVVTPSSDTVPESSKDADEQETDSERPQSSFLPLTEAPSPAPEPKQSYASKLKTGLVEQEATTTAIDHLTASVKAQSADLANAVKKLNQERELLAKEHKRLQDKNITEQAELYAQLNRHVIAMHKSVMAKAEEEKQNLYDQLKQEFDAKLVEMAKEFQVSLDGEAKKRRRLLEEPHERLVEERKARETSKSVTEEQCRTLQQQVSSIEQRISGVERCLRRPSEQERRPASSMVGYAQQTRPNGPSPRPQQGRPSAPAPRSQRDDNAANSSAQRQRSEGPDHGLGVSESAVRAHAMHVAYNQYDYDCELCA